tara:strand:- start:537 stop:2396 length:1860 start_codon:yes stop_codon:yes gene_type:complete
MIYRKEIDGLRAIAIIPVVIYHLNSSFAPFGYLGVDVFFVISGYLIGAIVSQKIENNTFSIKDFYKRRIKRIAPLYLLVAIIMVPLSLVYFVPSQIKDLYQSISASVVFLSNFFFYREIDYFNPFTQISPLIHTWSLAIEEQFYLFLPAFMIFFKGKSRNFLVFLLIIFSLSYYVYLSYTDHNLMFYSTFSRIWELLAGVYFAITFQQLKIKSIKYSNFISITVLFFLLLTLFSNVFEDISFVLRPAVVVFTLVLLVLKNNFTLRFFSFKPFVHIGLLSYSLYMIHQPIVSILKNNYIFESLNLVQVLSISLIIYIISLISYKFYEKPLRYSKISSKSVFTIFISFSILIFLTGYYGHKKNGFIDYFFEKNKGGYFFNNNYEAEKINSLKRSFKNDIFLDGSTNFLIIGDSQADDIFASLKYQNIDSSKKYSLQKIDDRFFEDVIANLSRDMHSETFFGDTQINLNRLRSEIMNSDVILLAALWDNKTYKKGLALSHYLAKEYDKKIIIVGSVFFHNPDLIASAFDKKKNNNINLDSLVRKKYLNKNVLEVSNKIPKLIKDQNIYFLDKINFFCDEFECSVFYDDKNPKLWDGCHITVYSINDYGLYINNQINTILSLN